MINKIRMNTQRAGNCYQISKTTFESCRRIQELYVSVWNGMSASLTNVQQHDKFLETNVVSSQLLKNNMATPMDTRMEDP